MPTHEPSGTEIASLLEKAKNTAAATEALTTLFPKSADLLGISGTEINSEVDDRALKRRISKSEFSSAYFRLTPDTSLWSKSQIASLMGSEPNAAFEAFSDKLANAPDKQKHTLRMVFIDILSAITGQDRHDLRDWFLAFIDNASVLVPKEDQQILGMFDLTVEDQLRILLLNMIKPLSLADRAGYIEYAIRNARDVSLLCELFRAVAGDVDPDGSTGRPEYGLGEASERLRTELVARVREMAVTGSIGSQALPANLLWFWWGSGFGTEVREYTDQALKTEDGLRYLLKIPINYVRSTAGNFERVDRRTWEKVLDVDALKQGALLLSEGADEAGRAVAQRFLDALARFDRGR